MNSIRQRVGFELPVHENQALLHIRRVSRPAKDSLKIPEQIGDALLHSRSRDTVQDIDHERGVAEGCETAARAWGTFYVWGTLHLIIRLADYQSTERSAMQELASIERSKSMPKQTNRVEPEYLGVDDAEIMTGRSRWSWRNDAYAGRIASIKVGRRLLIPVSEIRRVMAEGLRPARAIQL